MTVLRLYQADRLNCAVPAKAYAWLTRAKTNASLSAVLLVLQAAKYQQK
jgi:hypothetical protein